MTCGRCAIYETRPDNCRTFPTPESFRPLSCTFTFTRLDERYGSCDADACGVDNCCNSPREEGAPTAAFAAEGLPCRELRGLDAAPFLGAMADRHTLWVPDRGFAITRITGGWLLQQVDGQRIGLTVGATDVQMRRYQEGAAFSVQPPGAVPLSFALTPDEQTALLKLHPKRA